MQPTLVLSAPHPGILYINGRFAGEISADAPLIRPVSSCGAVYMDYRPLSSACRSAARKLVFSGGEPLQESAENAEDLNIVIWPGGTVEIEISPPANAPSPQRFQLAGREWIIDSDGTLRCGERRICALPEGAQAPAYLPLSGGAALPGSCAGGQYLITMDENFSRQTGFLRAGRIDIEGDGRIIAFSESGDTAGHAARETWRLTPEGLMMVSSEPAWVQGVPRRPATAPETARAMAEAALAGLEEEMEGHLSPALKKRIRASDFQNRCDLCVPMRYAPPDARPCIGLLRLLGERLARVTPMYYKAVPAGGKQESWLIDEIEFG